MARKKHPRTLTTDPAADYLGCSPKFLELDRVAVKGGKVGRGPPFRMIGTRHVYDVADLEQWKASNRFDPKNPPQRRARS
jgi:hypothetical protein